MIDSAENAAGRLKEARLISSVDFNRDFSEPEDWTSVRPIYLVLALVPVIGLIVYILIRFGDFFRRLARLYRRLRRFSGRFKRAASIAARIAEARTEGD